jgi:hypothetical protein
MRRTLGHVLLGLNDPSHHGGEHSRFDVKPKGTP